jgi:hypothetical protein
MMIGAVLGPPFLNIIKKQLSAPVISCNLIAGVNMAGLAHIGIGFALTLAAPEAPAAAIVISAEALDLLCIPAAFFKDRGSFIFKATHSLVGSLIWTAITMGITAVVKPDLRTILVIGIAVFSHWVLDYITHPMGAVMGEKPRNPQPPDLPLTLSDNSKLVGLGLYNNSVALSYVFDLGLTLVGTGLFIYNFCI